MLYIILGTVIFIVAYIYRNLRVSNYFLLVSLDWGEIPKLFGIQEGWLDTAELEEQFKENGVRDFEYYIIPKALKGSFSVSHIFDQQTNTFSESPNTAYQLLKGKNDAGNNFFVTGGFLRLAPNKKSCFWINYYEKIIPLQSSYKTIVILFDEKYLNIKNAHSVTPQRIPFKVHLIESKDDPDVPFKKVSETRELDMDDSNFSLWVNPRANRKQGTPFSWEELNKISKK